MCKVCTQHCLRSTRRAISGPGHPAHHASDSRARRAPAAPYTHQVPTPACSCGWGGPRGLAGELHLPLRGLAGTPPGMRRWFAGRRPPSRVCCVHMGLVAAGWPVRGAGASPVHPLLTCDDEPVHVVQQVDVAEHSSSHARPPAGQAPGGGCGGRGTLTWPRAPRGPTQPWLPTLC